MEGFITSHEQETFRTVDSSILGNTGWLSDSIPIPSQQEVNTQALLQPEITEIVGSSELPTEVTAQQFLDLYSGKTITEGMEVKILDDTTGSIDGDFSVDIQGEIEFGTGVELDISGLFSLDGAATEGSGLQLSEDVKVTAGEIEWVVDDGIQIGTNATLTTRNNDLVLQSISDGIQIGSDSTFIAEQGDLDIEATSQIQLEENFEMHAQQGSINVQTEEDGDLQIKGVESPASEYNISASKDIIFTLDGNFELGDNNLISAGGNFEVWIPGEEGGDIQIGTVDPTLSVYSVQAGGDINMWTNGDIQWLEGRTIYAGGDLTMEAWDAGDIQIQQVDEAFLFPRISVGHDLRWAADGDINVQRGDALGILPVPDIKAEHDVIMTGNGEIELEPGNWVQADHTIHLETDGVEVQVQPRANVTLEAGFDIILLAPEEDAGVKVGENGILKAGHNISVYSGLKDEGEGDTEIKENSILTAENNIFIGAGLNGVTKVKENSTLTAGNNITIESGEMGQTVVTDEETTLTASAVMIRAGLDGQCDVDPLLKIRATNQTICT